MRSGPTRTLRTRWPGPPQPLSTYGAFPALCASWLRALGLIGPNEETGFSCISKVRGSLGVASANRLSGCGLDGPSQPVNSSLIIFDKLRVLLYSTQHHCIMRNGP